MGKEKTRAPTHERASERLREETDRQTERMASATIWKQEEIDSLKADYQELKQVQNDAVTQYNPTPGTGRTGYMAIPPNNYPFYNKEEKYVPVVQPDGGQLSDWKPLYQPSKEQEKRTGRRRTKAAFHTATFQEASSTKACRPSRSMSR